MREGWREVRLGDVAEVCMGRQLSPDKRKGLRPRPYLRAANVGDLGIDLTDVLSMDFTQAEEAHFRIRKGDVLLVEGGNNKSVGCPALVSEIAEGLCIQNTLIRCRSTDTRRLDPRYLFLALRHHYSKGTFARLATGTTIMHLGQRRAVEVPVALAPLEEQRRIVDLIESVDAYIAALAAEEAALAATRSNLLGELLAQGGEDWTESTLGAIGDWYSGSTPKATNPAFYGGDIPFVAIGDLHGGLITSTERTLTSAGVQQIGRTAPPGAVFLSMYGSIGKVGMASCEMATNQAITWIECDSRLCTSRFVLMWLSWKSSEFDSQGRGATQRNINREMVKGMAILLPPLEEQQRIVDLVESVDTAIAEAAGARQSAVALRTATLGALLSGDHEIPSSYDDLLETV